MPFTASSAHPKCTPSFVFPQQLASPPKSQHGGAGRCRTQLHFNRMLQSTSLLIQLGFTLMRRQTFIADCIRHCRFFAYLDTNLDIILPSTLGLCLASGRHLGSRLHTSLHSRNHSMVRTPDQICKTHGSDLYHFMGQPFCTLMAASATQALQRQRTRQTHTGSGF